jgi:hypothetical protein
MKIKCGPLNSAAMRAGFETLLAVGLSLDFLLGLINYRLITNIFAAIFLRVLLAMAFYTNYFTRQQEKKLLQIFLNWKIIKLKSLQQLY